MDATNDREISTKVLSVTAARTPNLTRLDDYLRLAEVLGPVGDGAPLVLMRLLAGAELGIGPVAAMTGIHVIKGKISLGAHLIAGVIRRSGRYDYRVKRLDDAGCEIEFTLDGKLLGVSSFSATDAQRAGLAGGDNWRRHPRNMMYARAMSNGAKWYCPDVFGGPVYVPEELDAEVIDVTPEPAAPAPPEAVATAAPEVSAAAGPVTTEQVDRIAALVNARGLDWTKLNNRLWAKYSKWTVRELDAAQAGEVEAALSAKAAA